MHVGTVDWESSRLYCHETVSLWRLHRCTKVGHLNLLRLQELLNGGNKFYMVCCEHFSQSLITKGKGETDQKEAAAYGDWAVLFCCILGDTELA